jgi:predicted nucleic acid-binding protein
VVLVDTSVWVSHFRETHDCLTELLNNAEVVCHPFIIGELACGNLKNRTSIIALLKTLPTALLVEHEELLSFIEVRKVMGKGLGYVDVHLLAASLLTGIPIWTLDKKLDKVAEGLQCKYRQRAR